MEETMNMYLRIVEKLEAYPVYQSTMPFGEPQLGKRSLYPDIGGRSTKEMVRGMNYILNYSDGWNTPDQIATLSGGDRSFVLETSKRLEKHGLLTEI